MLDDYTWFKPIHGLGFEHYGVGEGWRNKPQIEARYLGHFKVEDALASKWAAVEATMRFNAMAFETADVDRDRQLTLVEFGELVASLAKHGNDQPYGSARAARAIQMQRSFDSSKIAQWFRALDHADSGSLSITAFFVFALEGAIVASGTKGGLQAFFSHWDKSGDRSLSHKEFRRMCERLGFGEEADALIAGIDTPLDPGELSFNELMNVCKAHRKEGARALKVRREFMRIFANCQAAATRRSAQLSSNRVDLAPPRRTSSSAVDVPATTAEGESELRAWLLANAREVGECFMAMDEDGDGQLGQGELRKALHFLGCAVTPETLNAIFDDIDTDASFKITFNELRAWMEKQE